VIEASEESGSPDLRTYIGSLKARIGNPSVVITLDSEDRDGDRLWLTQSLRGMVNGFLTIETISGTMHSGLASGVVPSSMRILRMLLSRVENSETGHIINEILSPPLSDEVRSYAEGMARDIPNFIDGYDLPSGFSAAGETLAQTIENNLVRASLEITGLTGLPEAEKSGNVSVGKLTARVSLRLPPGVDPDTAATELKRIFETDTPYGARVSFDVTDADWGWMAKSFSPAMRERLWSTTQETLGTEPGLLGVGASIPFVQIMVNEFPNAEHLLTGILSQSSHAHGPNENMSIRKVKRLTEVVAVFLSKTV
jgi:acetylornithine deacetylase/succinyl-diaminopimelate desuccinylase-like protein